MLCTHIKNADSVFTQKKRRPLPKESIGALRTIMQAEQTHLDVRTVSSQPGIVSGTGRVFPH